MVESPTQQAASAAETVKEPTIAPIKITRNGLTAELTEQAEPKGPTKDEPFLFLNPEDEVAKSIEKLATWTDPAWLLSRCLRIIKKEFKSIFESAMDKESGLFDASKFAIEARDYKFFNESAKVLTEQLNELVLKFVDINMSTPEGFKIADEMRTKMKVLSTAIANKKRNKDDSDDDESEVAETNGKVPVVAPAPAKPVAPVHTGSAAQPLHVHKG